MDSWYMQRESDLFVLNDQLIFEAPSVEDRSPLLTGWCQLGFVKPEKTESPSRDGAESKSTAKEFVFDRQTPYCQVGKGPLVHESESGSRAWEGGSVTCSSSRTTEDPVYDQADFAMQNSMDWIDDVFLNSLLEEDNDNMQNMSQSQQMSDSMSRSQSFENFMTNMLTDPARRDDLVATSSVPLLKNDTSESWGKMEDTSSSFYMMEEPKRTAGPVMDGDLSVLMPADISASNQSETVAYADDPKCWEATVLQELEDVTIHLSDDMRMCFRDALYRLAKNSNEQHGINQNRSPNDRPSTGGVQSESSNLGGSCHEESRTNVVDRTIANLMFNNPYFHAQGVPYCPGSVHSDTGGLASNGSYYSPNLQQSPHCYIGPT